MSFSLKKHDIYYIPDNLSKLDPDILKTKREKQFGKTSSPYWQILRSCDSVNI